MLELVVLSYSGMHPLRLSFDHIFCYALYHNIGVAPDFVYHAPHHIAFIIIGYSHPTRMWFELAPHLHQWALHALLYLVVVHGPSIRFLISDSYFSGRTVLINDTFLTHLTYNGVSTSHGGAVPHTRVSILHGRDVPTLYSRCLDLSRGRHLHILFFSRFYLHVLLFPPFSSISLRYASLTRRSGTFFRIHLPRHDIITSPFSRKKEW